jgi:RNA polymerase sporulation-specific sigma factor
LSNTENMRYLADIRTASPEESAANLRYVMSNADGRYFCVRLKENDVFVGSIGYTVKESDEIVHMGYFILPEFQGMGIVTEASGRMLEFAFDEDGRKRVEIGCHRDNIASRRVMEKSGFIFVSENDERFEYAINRDDYLSQNLDLVIKEYTPMVRKIARGFSVPGIEEEDLVQEGLIGLYGAVLAFSPAKGVPFEHFARLCATRRMNSAVKAALRGKQSPLAAYEPISHYHRDSLPTPEEAVLLKEEFSAIEAWVNVRLSRLERKVLALHLGGFKKDEIAQKLGRERKDADNALFRARRKIKLVLEG